eukprot:4253602-Lingulodinium_polyedra.AAC.1
MFGAKGAFVGGARRARVFTKPAQGATEARVAGPDGASGSVPALLRQQGRLWAAAWQAGDAPAAG